MKRRMTSLFLAFSVLFVTTVAAVAALLPAQAQDAQVQWEADSPFRYMVDEQRLESPQPSQEIPGTPGSFRVAGFFASELTTPVLSPETDLREMLARRPQEVAVPEDRYIVKYKEGREADFKEAVTPLALESDAVARKTLPAELRAVPNLSAALPAGDFAELDRLETLTLAEPILPSELAEQLAELGVAEYVEYICPDYKLSLDSLSLELTEGNTEGTEALSDTGTTETGASSTSTETETETTSETTSNVTTPPPSTGGPLAQAVPVLVAVLDTGVDVGHTSLAGYLTEGFNVITGGNDVYDETRPLAHAHNTHVTGLIVGAAAETGAAVEILPIQVFENGYARTSDVLAGIAIAKEQGAAIVNCSFGTTAENPALYEAIQNSSMLFVCAAGNNRRDMAETPSYPAAYDLPNVLSVTSVNDDGGFSYFSNYGETVIDIAAPGRSVVSTLPENRTGPMTGTSMAAGVVTGAAAAVLSLTAPDSGADYDAETLRRQLLATADRLENLQNKVKEGRRLNLEQALQGETNDEILMLNPEDDFDVHGYQPTPSEQFELYTGAGAVVQASAGTGHTLILKENGTVWAWGDNTYGQLGDGTTTDRLTPVQVVGLTNIAAISAGDYHNLVADLGGSVWAWGRNDHGQLGDDSIVGGSVVVQVMGVYADIIAAGGAHSLALTWDSDLYGWGSNMYAQVGTEDSFRIGWGQEDIPYPSWIYDMNVGIIAADHWQSAGTQSDCLYLWGYDENAYDGVGELREVTYLSNAQAIEMGEGGHLVLSSDGLVTVFDDNGSEEIDDLDNVTAIAKGDEFGMALKSDGTVWSWGINDAGQLGHGNTTDTDTPTQITGLTGVVAIAAGDAHSVFVLSDGTVKTCGNNTYGQLGDDTTTTRLSPVSVTVPDGAPDEPVALAVTLTPSSVTVPASGTVTSTATATVWDGDGNILTGQTVTYSLLMSRTGVSIDSSTGVVTVSSTATAGTVTVRGTHGNVTGTATLTLTTSTFTMTLQATANEVYNISVKGNNIGSFGGVTYTVTYDPSKLELQDFAAQAKRAITTPGTVAGTGLTIVSHSNGVLTFTVQKTIPSGRKWSGVLTVLKFRALSTGSSSLQIS
ncbi:MAG: S8 family serine peptidase [Oscillospiraceae bacterium]|nr:S8 family serine peptidase [Oscillospiraceae bacterium]